MTTPNHKGGRFRPLLRHVRAYVGMYRPVMALAVAVVITVFGCYGGPGWSPADESSPAAAQLRMRAEAYSFNARLRRQGKPTSFKLEIYQTDSLLGLSGRGYLGKGALRGRLTSDSLRVYFPSTKEYVHEALEDLLSGGDCPFPLAELDVISLFYNLPDSMPLNANLHVAGNYRKAKRPVFKIQAEGCPWLLELTYDRRETGWRVRKFEFSNGRGVTLRGVREKYKARATIKLKRFEIVLPPDAVQLKP